MPQMIRDGRGTGFLAGVSVQNRLITQAVIEPEQSHVSEHDGLTFTSSTGIVTLGAADTWHWVLYLKNTDPARNFYLSAIASSWNGGSTNFNRTLYMRSIFTAAEPSANNTAITPANSNFTSNNVALATVYKWDGVGTGMTSAVGITGGEVIHDKGYSSIPFDGSIIYGFNGFFGIQVKSSEIGDFGIAAGFFYKLTEGVE